MVHPVDWVSRGVVTRLVTLAGHLEAHGHKKSACGEHARFENCLIPINFGRAEGERFELSVECKPYDGLANRWFRPLTHPSIIKKGTEVRRIDTEEQSALF